MTTQFAATQPKGDLRGIILFGFPLHQPGKPSVERAEHLKTVKVPMLFLQGSRDELAEYTLIDKVCASLRQATLVKIEGANHAFKAGKQDVISLLASESRSWIDKRIKSLSVPNKIK